VPPAGCGRLTALWSAVDHEYEELLEEETAEPKESSKEPNYHAYHALFSHFPKTLAFGKASLSNVRTSEERRRTACPRN